LSTIGVDGNDQMFPYPRAITEGGNNDNLVWFLSNLKSYINSTDRKGWTLISDKHKVTVIVLIFSCISYNLGYYM